MANEKMYNELSWIWPIISPPEDYAEESEQFLDVIRKFSRIKKPKTLLDLGCGGGHVDHALCKHFQLTGIDISENMLALARSLNPSADYFPGDMRSVRLGKKFDVVIAADAICYMLSEDELRAAFTTAWEHLAPGGVFVTYVEVSRESFIQNEVSYGVHRKDDILITMIENNFDPDRSDTTYEYTVIYIIRKGGGMRVESETHVAGIFPLATWKKLLGEVGFEVSQLVLYGEDESENFPFFVCVKP